MTNVIEKKTSKMQSGMKPSDVLEIYRIQVLDELLKDVEVPE